MQQQRAIMLSVLAVLALSAGCASQQPMGQETGGLARPDSVLQDVKNLPKWVTQKGAAFSGERRVFYGVGSAAALQNPSLRRRAAEGQARRDIAQTMQTYVAALQKQYLAETTAGDMSKQSVEQQITDTMKQVTEATLVGAQIVEYWEHPQRNEAYALARLDLEQFLDVMKSYQSAVGQSKELDAKVREYVQRNAEKAHDELNAELGKKSGGSATVAPAPMKTKTTKKVSGREMLAAGELVPVGAGGATQPIEAGDLVNIAYGDLVEIAGGQDLATLASHPVEIGAADVLEVSYGDLIAIADASVLEAGRITMEDIQVAEHCGAQATSSVRTHCPGDTSSSLRAYLWQGPKKKTPNPSGVMEVSARKRITFDTPNYLQNGPSNYQQAETLKRLETEEAKAFGAKNQSGSAGSNSQNPKAPSSKCSKGCAESAK